MLIDAARMRRRVRLLETRRQADGEPGYASSRKR
jgi:hypothetical protein